MNNFTAVFVLYFSDVYFLLPVSWFLLGSLLLFSVYLVLKTIQNRYRAYFCCCYYFYYNLLLVVLIVDVNAFCCCIAHCKYKKKKNKYINKETPKSGCQTWGFVPKKYFGDTSFGIKFTDTSRKQIKFCPLI